MSSTQAPVAAAPADERPAVVTGVDTHADTHHVAVLASTGARLGDRQVSATATGYAELVEFITSFGQVTLVGIEGTGSYGAGLARHLREVGIEIREVIRPKRAARRRGKSDPIDAYAAANAALAEPEALPTAKSGDGVVEQIRVLLTARRSAVKARQAAGQQIKMLLVTAPQAIRDRFSPLTDANRIEALAATRPSPATESVTAATSRTLRILARRHQHLTGEIEDVETDLDALTRQANLALVTAFGFGTVTAAELLVSAGDNPDRLRTEASFAALAGVAPIPASSGKTNRHRLNRGGDRRANWALHQVALVRMSTDARTKAYVDKLTKNGKTSKDILRCLKRAIAREVWHHLVHPEPVPAVDDLRPLRQAHKLSLHDVAKQLETSPMAISRLERSISRNDQLADTYRTWLLTA